MRGLLLLLSVSCLWGQPSGITTSVARTLVLPADVARFELEVTAPFPTGLDHLLSQLSPLEVRATDLTGETVSLADSDFSGGPWAVSEFHFVFTRHAQIAASLAQRLAVLEKLQPTGTTFRYTMTLTLSERSVEELKSTLQPQLLIEARRRAQALADAANLTLGPVESISSERRTISSVIRDPYPLLGLPAQRVSFFVSAPLREIDGLRATYTLTARFAVQ